MQNHDTQGFKIAYELFGKCPSATIYQACKNGSLNFKMISTSLNDNVGSVDSTFENTLDLIDKFKLAMNNLKIAVK